MRCKNGSLPQAFKLGQVYGRGLSIGMRNQRPKVSNIIGSSNESDIIIEGIETKALLDTGSCVSILCQSFYDKHLKHLPLHPVEDILRLECADGSFMHYTGYIQVQILTSGIPSEHIQDCIFLIVPDTDYSKNVPLLICTNILDELLLHCKSELGENFLQNSALHTSWYLAFRCMVVRQRELKRSKNKLAIIRSAESNTLPFQQTAV